MVIGVGLDQSLKLSFPDYRELAREACALGYASMWTPAGLGIDAFQVCGQWSAASAAVVPGGLTTGISVVPAPIWTVPALADVAATMGALSGGRFILGIGTGGLQQVGWRETFGLPAFPPIALMRDYLVTLRAMLAGKAVAYDGIAVHLHGAKLAFQPPRVPVYLGALGPQMLRLAGSAADGAALNWCSSEQVARNRSIVADGARRAGRDPSEVSISEYIRVCVDDDVDAARRGLARAVMGYALAQPGTPKELGYRGHFARMGFDKELVALEESRERGATDVEIIEAFPPEILQRVGYFGPAAGAAAAFRKLADGLDEAIVRVVPARPGVDAVITTMRACRPDLIQ